MESKGSLVFLLKTAVILSHQITNTVNPRYLKMKLFQKLEFMLFFHCLHFIFEFHFLVVEFVVIQL